MEEANTWPQFLYTAHSSLPLLCMYVHSSFWVSVATPFICLWTYCVLSHGSLILPQFPTYRSCLRFPFSSRTFLFPLPFPFFSPFSPPKISSINSYCFSHHPLRRCFPNLYRQHFQVPAGHLHLEVLLAFKVNMSKTELINSPLTLIFFPVLA